MSEPVGKELFLSYGREPEVISFVTQLKHDLQSSGFSVWLDTEDIPAGCDWHAAIGTGLDQCKALIAVISNKYISSRYCKSELYTANGDQKLIFPVIVENVDFSATERARGVKYVVSGINWTMFRFGYDDYQSSLVKLVAGMKEQGLGPAVVDGLPEKMAQLQVSPSAPPRPSSPISNPGYSSPYLPQMSSANSSFQQTTPPGPYTTPPGPYTTPPRPYTTPPHPSQYPPYPYAHFSHSPSPHGQAYPPYYTTPPSGGHPPPLTYSPGQPYYSPHQTTAYHPYPVANEGIPQTPPPPYIVSFSGSDTGDDTVDAPPPPVVASEKRPNFKVGMKLEAVDRRFPYYVCVATVMDRNNDEIMIHFDGWGPEYNYWCSRNSVDLHPPGWCQKHKWDLQQPINQSWPGWTTYLSNTESEGAEEEMFTENQLAGPGSLLFSPNMKLEAKDRMNPTTICAATIRQVSNGRVLVHFDGWGDRYDYWCEAGSTDLHPAMWCGKNGKQVTPPNGYKGQFKWSVYLADENVNPAPAHLFTEEQLSKDGHNKSRSVQPSAETLGGFQVGVKLEAKDRLNPTEVCAASIKDIKDGRLLIQFDGWSTKFDYWCKPTSTDIHPVGWCEANGRQVNSPNGYSEVFNWDSYLVNQSATAAPNDLFTKDQRAVVIQPSASPSSEQFKAGMKLEARDRQNPSMICVATITEIKNGRLLIHFDGWSHTYDYWCEPTTTDIHPVGWCQAHNHTLQAPCSHTGPFSWSSYLTSTGSVAAPSHLFTQQKPASSQFKAGMKLEARDRENPTQICVATITEVKNGQLLIHFDGWSNTYDYWCDPTTTDIHPIGWCEAQGQTLHWPKGDSGPFKWSSYLASTSSIAAPSQLFTESQRSLSKPKFTSGAEVSFNTKFKAGMKLEARDRQNPSLICVATITEVKNGRLLIHFAGWSNTYDYWCEPTTTDIHPIGWCASHHHALQKPHGYQSSFSWDIYLEECHGHQSGSIAAPITAFTAKQCQ